MKAHPPGGPPLKIGSAHCDLPRSRDVLVLVDFINPMDFEGAENLAPAALEAARATARLKAELAAAGVPVIYANDNYGLWRSDFRETLANCQARPGEAGEIARLLAPKEGDLAILKPRQSGFFATPLELLLTQMHAHRIVLVGLAADICVQLTAMDAHLRGYALWVPADCTAAESPQAKQAALDYMAGILKADVRPTSARAGRHAAGATAGA